MERPAAKVTGAPNRLWPFRFASERHRGGPDTKYRKTTPCKVEWAPVHGAHAARVRTSDGPSSRPTLISIRLYPLLSRWRSSMGTTLERATPAVRADRPPNP